MLSLKRSPIALALFAAGLAMASLVGLAAAPTSSQAGWTAPSFLDSTFNPDANGVVNEVLVQPDGKILIGGAFTTVGGETRGRVARLNANGTVDNSFADPALNGTVESMALQADGKILVGGNFTQVGAAARNSIARLNTNGTLDTSFDDGSITGVIIGQNPPSPLIVRAIAVQSDGKIMVGGDFRQSRGTSPETYNFALARLNTDGTDDTSFVSPFGVFDRAWTVEVLSSGKILIGGQSGNAANNLVRLNSDGSRDSSFVNPPPNSSVFDTAVQADGKILFGGNFTQVGGETRNRFARLNADGTLDTGFNPNVNSGVESVSLRADGKILIGGTFTQVGGTARTRVAIVNTDGTVNAAFFPTVGTFNVYSAVSQADGNILIGGNFTTVEGQTRNRVARVFPELEPAAPASTAPPTISGTAEVGQTLTADDIGDWTGYPEPEFTYQWQRCEAGEPISEIFGETGVAPSGIVFDSSGNVYIANSGSNNVTKITPGGVSSVLGTTGTTPVGIAIDSAGNIYTANRTSNNVTKITPGGVSSVLGATGSGPFGIAVDSSGNVYTANFNSNNVTKITPGGSSSVLGTTGANPNEIVLDSSGNVYTANFNSDNVTKITPGGSSSVFATTGDGPYGIDLDSAGNLYTANHLAATVTKITPGGSSSVLGTTGTQPFGIASDSSGNVYTANYGSSTVTKITPGGSSSVLGTTGANPIRIAIDSAGNVYTSNNGDNSVTKIAPSEVCTDIPSATNETYTLTGDDEGKKVRVKVTGANSEGSASANSAATATVDPSPAPVNTDPPTISGTPEVGSTLTADSGEWTGEPTFGYQWQRCDADGTTCTVIDGAIEDEYTLTGDDEGKKVRVKVTATNNAGSASAESAPTATIDPAPAPVNTDPPTISGETIVPQTLSADPGTWSGSPDFEYQWQRCTGDPGVKWTARTAATQSIWTSVAWGGPEGEEKFVATGLSGALMTSPDGVNWTTRTPADSKNWISVTWGGPPGDRKFVAVADSGTGNRVMTSPDGINWTAQASTADNNWYGVTWGGPAGQEKFVAVSASGTGNRVMTSPDGINWTARTSAADNNWVSVTWGGPAGQEKFVAVAFTGTGNRVMTSPDGITWTAQASAADNDWISVTWGGPAGQEKFVAVGLSGAVMTSPDGVNWTSQTSLADNAWTSVVWGGPEGEEQFVAVADNGSAERVMTSPDGIEWTLQDPAGDSGWRGLAWGGSFGDEKFVAVANSGAGSRVMTSGLDCVDIDGATKDEYKLTADDVDARIRVKVTATNDAGTTVAYSDLTAPIDPEPLSPAENTEAPTIEGSAGIGASLSADKGTWTGNPAPTYAYQWQRCDEDGENCVDIDGATSDSYTQTRDDVGKKIRVKVTGSNSEGSASAFSAPTEIVPGVPANTTPPSISGEPKVGETLTAEPGEWSAYPDPTFTYQWQRCNADGTNCVDINGATGETYDPTAADTGKEIRVRVTATNSAGSASGDSGKVGPVPGSPSNTSAPTISGTARTGKKVKAKPGQWAGYPAPTFRYQWQRCDENGANCVNISGAGKSSYKLTDADVGKKIQVIVTATNAQGSSSAASEAFGPIKGPGSSGKPNLGVSVKAPRKIKAGRAFRVTVKVTNRPKPRSLRTDSASASSATTARKLRTCVRLPFSTALLKPGRGKASGRSVCWTRSTLKMGKSVNYWFTVRALPAAAGSVTFRATASASNAKGARSSANGKDRVRLLPAGPGPKPRPVTG